MSDNTHYVEIDMMDYMKMSHDDFEKFMISNNAPIRHDANGLPVFDGGEMKTFYDPQKGSLVFEWTQEKRSSNVVGSHYNSICEPSFSQSDSYSLKPKKQKKEWEPDTVDPEVDIMKSIRDVCHRGC